MLCASLLVVLPAAAGPAAAGGDYVEGEVIATFRPSVGIAEAQRWLQDRGIEVKRHFAGLSNWRGRQTSLIRAAGRTTASLLAELANAPAVESAEPNYLRHAFASLPPNDPLFQRLWALQNTGQSVNGLTGVSRDDISFIGGWSLSRPATSQVVVAVIDSGVYYTHPDLAANMWVNTREIPGNGVDDDGDGYVDDYYGFDFADGLPDPVDSGFHGTHVAGTIAAVGNNGLGIAGVNFQAKIMALRASSDGGTSLPSSAIIEAIQYATMMKQRGVDVVAINASYGGSNYSSAESAAIEAAGSVGIILCAAAGNDSANNDVTPTYPANYRLPNMIVVAATDQNDALATFSNYGATTVDLGAPGVNILSTTPPGVTSYVHTASATYAGDALEFAGTTTGLSGQIYYCGLGYPTNFPAQVRGNLALISRGTLFFTEKVNNAIMAGALGVILYNNTNAPFSGTLQYASNWIPAVMLSQADGLALKAALPTSGTLFSAKDPSVIYRYLEGTSMAAPHVAGAVSFAAINFPDDTVAQRIQRVLANVDPLPALAGKVVTGGRLDLRRIVDSDSNGLPDWWEQNYFGQTGVDPNADPDGDGASNLQEFIADTDPLNSASALRLSANASSGLGNLLQWSAGPQSRQYLQRSPTPWLAGSWVNVFTNTSLTSVSLLDQPPATNRAWFYRLRAERQ